MSVNGVMCVCSSFQVIKHIFKFVKTGLTVNIHVSTKTCVTGNNFILHKVLDTGYNGMNAARHGNGTLMVDGMRPELSNSATWFISSVGTPLTQHSADL